MVMNFVKNNRHLILINLLLFAVFWLGYGRFGDIIVDSFREAYIPAEVAAGKVLYKNIFTIYAPFAYLLNALLFKIFGVNLKVLYFAGLFASAGVLNLVYFIAKRFLDENCSLGIVLFIIAGAVLSPNVFNMIFPYSYGVLYGLLFVLGSVWFALDKKFPLTYLMYSFAVCSKYEFILLLPLLVYISGKKDIWKNISALVIPVLLVLTPLVLQGLRFEDLLTSFGLILAMLSSKSMHWFYSVSGLEFQWALVPVYLINLLKMALPLALVWYFRSWKIIPIVLVYLYFAVSPALLIYVFPLILILFVWRFKTLTRDEKLFVLASLLISAKIFFALTLKSYGVFFLPFALISLFILVPKDLRKPLLVLTLGCALVLSIKNAKELCSKNVKIQTGRGVVYAAPFYGQAVKELVSYLESEIPKDAKVVIYPECLAVNFLTARSSDNKFYSLIPMYVETFGEKLIISRLDFVKPEYIVTSNYDTSNYYYKEFGADYGVNIKKYIEDNYTLEKEIGADFRFKIYKTTPLD